MRPCRRALDKTPLRNQAQSARRPCGLCRLLLSEDQNTLLLQQWSKVLDTWAPRASFCGQLSESWKGSSPEAKMAAWRRFSSHGRSLRCRGSTCVLCSEAVFTDGGQVGAEDELCPAGRTQANAFAGHHLLFRVSYVLAAEEKGSRSSVPVPQQVN